MRRGWSLPAEDAARPTMFMLVLLSWPLSTSRYLWALNSPTSAVLAPRASMGCGRLAVLVIQSANVCKIPPGCRISAAS